LADLELWERVREWLSIRAEATVEPYGDPGVRLLEEQFLLPEIALNQFNNNKKNPNQKEKGMEKNQGLLGSLHT
jgi:hypothetical protein